MLREDFGIKARGKERSRPVWLNPEDFLYLCAAGVVPVRLGADGYCTSSLKSGAN